MIENPGPAAMLPPMPADILSDLNPAQRDAVQHRDGPLIVLAGAGSGKTRVITRRIAWLLREGVGSHQILALTFTNKAAGEMARRVEELGGGRVQVATFHSSCARFLRRDASYLGYPQSFSIYDTYDRDACIKQLLHGHGINIGGAVTPAKVGGRISQLKNLGVEPEDFVAGMGEVDAVVRQIFAPYQLRMKELGAMDFDDLLLRFGDLLEQHPAIAEQYQQRFRYLLVDEFQDTNLVQYRLVRRLAEKHRNLCVVGDPDQSIYKFRGAEIRNILDFQDDYPEAKLIRLETNYRSSACILGAAQKVIENNRDRLEKDLTTEADFGAQIQIVRNGGAEEEAEAVVGQIQGLQREGVDLDEVAIFYRAHFLSRAIEQALRQEGVPYDIVGGLTFFERREIKDVLAYLKVVANPLDDVSMLRVINVPPRGLGKVGLQKISDRAAAEQMSLYEAVCDADCRAVLSGKARKGLDSLARVFASLSDRTQPQEAMETILRETGYMEYACNLGDPQDVSREENLQELVSDAAKFAEEDPDSGLAGYLQHVSLLTSQDEEAVEGPHVSLMTVHSAKGLEFDHVQVIGLEEGIFPHSRSLESPADMEEERRLMYVAITRARKTLALHYAAFRMVQGMTQRQDMSRFVREIPDEFAVRGEAHWGGYDGDAEDPDGDEGFADFEPDYGDEPQELRAGLRVRHPVYGEGEVLRVSGEGLRCKVVVRFAEGRERTLIPEYSQLRVLPSENAW